MCTISLVHLVGRLPAILLTTQLYIPHIHKLSAAMMVSIAAAAKAKKLELVRQILESATSDVNQCEKLLESVDDDHKGTALYWCSVHGYTDLVIRLLQMGAPVNRANCHKHTALHAAADMGHPYIVKLLLDCGANPNLQNQSSQTALHLAAYRGNVEIAAMLIRNGASQTLKNSINMTAKDTALSRKHQALIDLFTEGSLHNSTTSNKGLQDTKRNIRQSLSCSLPVILQRPLSVPVENCSYSMPSLPATAQQRHQLAGGYFTPQIQTGQQLSLLRYPHQTAFNNYTPIQVAQPELSPLYIPCYVPVERGPPPPYSSMPPEYTTDDISLT